MKRLVHFYITGVVRGTLGNGCEQGCTLIRVDGGHGEVTLEMERSFFLACA